MNVSKMDLPMTITLDSQKNIKYVCQGFPPKDVLDSGYTTLGGKIADLLYLAVTGHEFGEHPDTATGERAIKARWDLIINSEARVAHLALVQFGHRIRPWLGVTPLDDTGRPVRDEGVDVEIQLEVPDGDRVSMMVLV